MAVRVDLGFVVPEGLHFGIGEVFEFGDADAVLAGNHAVEAAGNAHNAGHCFMGGLQHGVIVGINRDIGVHIAVARVHV